MKEKQVGPVWLKERRAGAVAKFESLPLPDRKQEAFKHTYVGGVDFISPHNSSVTFPEHLKKGDLGESHLLCIHGDRAFSVKEKKEEVLFFDLQSGLKKAPELLKKYLKMPLLFKEDKFAQLVEGNWENGFFLYVPDGVKVSGVLRVLQYLSAEQRSAYYRGVLILGKGAKCTFVDEYLGGDFQQGLGCALLDVVIEENAQLHYSHVQALGSGTRNFHRRQFTLQKGAQLELWNAQLGGSKGQEHLELILEGAGASAKVCAIGRGDREQHLDFVANAQHKGEHTTSVFDHWVVLADQAKGVFNGLVQVEQNAFHSDASQKSRSLLLSKEASVHGMPKLIIGTHEVACGHGFSTSRINLDHLYYLESRGIEPREARKIIIDGFTEPVVSHLPTQALRNRVSAILENKSLGNNG